MVASTRNVSLFDPSRSHPTRCKPSSLNTPNLHPAKSKPTNPTPPTNQSHNLWYTSRQTPSTHPPYDPTTGPDQAHHHTYHHHPSPRDRDARRAQIERTPLARLRKDEAAMEKRRANVANYATQWLKPPGVPKTLQQIREERREAAEHAEAVERERQHAAVLAQVAADGEGLEGMEVEEVDLDEEVPEGETFGFDGEEEEDEDMVSESEEEEESEELEETENDAGAVSVSPAEEEQVREVRAAEDRLMDRMAREEDGALDAVEAFGDEGEARDEMLEEDDLVNLQSTPPAAARNADVSMGMDMDMDADLDGGIPDGDGGDEYEHTDSDEEIDESTRDISFAVRSSAVRPRQQLRRSVHPRSSLRSRASLAQSEAADISELLSGEGSSYMDGSPYPRRRG